MTEREFQIFFTSLLEEILDRWPKKDNEKLETYTGKLTPYLSSDFNTLDLINGIEAYDSIVSMEQKGQNVQIEFIDVQGYSQCAIFLPGQEGKWQLSSLKMRCPVCFGEGTNDGSKCTICGGTGWGTS